MGRYISGMVAGLAVGATIGMIVMPQLDRKTQKKIKKAGYKLLNFAEESYGDIIDFIN
ncbi:MAG: YtxH domain-containing protein [Clostridium sp.]|uniref:YtxH-like protein n=1 Tax=Clostridium paraputrificum TaxID=29363 RepID=A0A6N3FNK0_9CLOT|nr:YtxH domain-containing protein [Clostridium sp.]MBS5925802.1 YtxH domain-containing protein [Clostridium sp.]MBS5985868.1 YtxH domain-containing protein [Clostridium sp.]